MVGVAAGLGVFCDRSQGPRSAELVEYLLDCLDKCDAQLVIVQIEHQVGSFSCYADADRARASDRDSKARQFQQDDHVLERLHASEAIDTHEVST